MTPAFHDPGVAISSGSQWTVGAKATRAGASVLLSWEENEGAATIAFSIDPHEALAMAEKLSIYAAIAENCHQVLTGDRS